MRRRRGWRPVRRSTPGSWRGASSTGTAPRRMSPRCSSVPSPNVSPGERPSTARWRGSAWPWRTSSSAGTVSVRTSAGPTPAPTPVWAIRQGQIYRQELEMIT